MKKIIFILMIHSAALQAGDLIINTSAPDNNPVCSGTLCNLGPVIYPMTVDVQLCSTFYGVDMTSIGLGLATAVHDLSDNNCASKIQYFVLDGRAYVMQDIPNETEEIYIDLNTAADIIWLKQDLFNCHTLSGLPFDTTSNNPPVLIGNSLIFNTPTNETIQTIYSDPSYIAYKIKSTNGDIVCDNAIVLPPITSQVLFANGFE